MKTPNNSVGSSTEECVRFGEWRVLVILGPWLGFRAPFVITRMVNRLFITLCIAGPVVLALVRPIYPHSPSVAAVFAITGLVLFVILLGWSVWKLFSDRRHVMIGFGAVFVSSCFLVVVADYFAAYEHGQRKSVGTNVSGVSK